MLMNSCRLHRQLHLHIYGNMIIAPHHGHIPKRLRCLIYQCTQVLQHEQVKSHVVHHNTCVSYTLCATASQWAAAKHEPLGDSLPEQQYCSVESSEISVHLIVACTQVINSSESQDLDPLQPDRSFFTDLIKPLSVACKDNHCHCNIVDAILCIIF